MAVATFVIRPCVWGNYIGVKNKANLESIILEGAKGFFSVEVLCTLVSIPEDEEGLESKELCLAKELEFRLVTMKC